MGTNDVALDGARARSGRVRVGGEGSGGQVAAAGSSSSVSGKLALLGQVYREGGRERERERER